MPANDNTDPDERWKRAQLLLEAHARIANSEAHPYDHPAASIRGLLTDLMHYCASRNVGARDTERLDFDAIMKSAKTDYQEQAIAHRHKEEMQKLNARHEMQEPRPDFDRGELNQIHAQQREDLADRLTAERRERERARAAELRAEIEADERAKRLEIEQGLREE